MSVKKMMLLAMAAVAAIAFAVPAAASAGGFNHEGNPITIDKDGNGPTGEFTGFIAFGTGLGTFGCIAHAEVMLTTEEAHLEELDITTSECEGTGALTGCELENDEVTGLPWEVTPIGGETIALDDVLIHNEFVECPLSEISITFDEVTLTPNNPAAIASVGISGEGVIDTLGQELEAEAFGEMAVVGGDAGTYGIE